MKITAIIFPLIFTIIPINNAYSCSAMFLNDNSVKVVGRTHDWFKNSGYINLHKKGTDNISRFWGKAKNQNLTPVKWVSKYDSIIVHSKSKIKNAHMPIGGINSNGLVVCQLYVNHDNTQNLAFKQTNTAIMASQWLIYCLDNYKDVNEIIANITNLKVFNNYHAHWFAADNKGNCAVFETVNGNLTISYGQPLTVPVLTNHIYSLSCAELSNYQEFGGKKKIPEGHKSISRFIRGAYLLKQYNKNEDPIKFMFSTMNKLEQPATSHSPTKWTTVYDLKNKIIYYKGINENKITKISLDEVMQKSNYETLKKMNIKL